MVRRSAREVGRAAGRAGRGGGMDDRHQSENDEEGTHLDSVVELTVTKKLSNNFAIQQASNIKKQCQYNDKATESATKHENQWFMFSDQVWGSRPVHDSQSVGTTH